MFVFELFTLAFRFLDPGAVLGHCLHCHVHLLVPTLCAYFPPPLVCARCSSHVAAIATGDRDSFLFADELVSSVFQLSPTQVCGRVLGLFNFFFEFEERRRVLRRNSLLSLNFFASFLQYTIFAARLASRFDRVSLSSKLYALRSTNSKFAVHLAFVGYPFRSRGFSLLVTRESARARARAARW